MLFARINDPVLGIVKRGWGKWSARVRTQHLPRELAVIVEIGRNESVEPFLAQARNVVNRFRDFQRDLASQLFEDYWFYRRMDIEEGGLTEDDFKPFPQVELPEQVWNVLMPYRFRLGHQIDKYLGNAHLLMDVAWPNPHFFQVFLQLEAESWKYMHTELVG